MPNPPPHTPETESPPSPRAFSHATGYIFQSIGFLLAIGSCCWWSISGWVQDEIPTRVEGQLVVPNINTEAASDQIWAMIAVPFSFVSALGLLVIGLGLHQDRLKTGRGPLLLTAIAALYFWTYLGFAIVQFPATGRITLVAIMALIWTACALLAGVSAEELKRAPPLKRSETAWTSRDEDDLRNALSPRSPDRTSRSDKSDPPE